MQELLTEQDIATMLHTNKRFVQDLRRAKVLHPAKFGKHWLYRKEEIEDYIEHMFSLNERK